MPHCDCVDEKGDNVRTPLGQNNRSENEMG